METVNVNLYQFDELNDKAKDKARNWMREGADYWDEQPKEDAQEVGLKITGYDIDRGAVCDLEIVDSYAQTAELILANHGETCGTYKAAQAYKEAIARIDPEESTDAPGGSEDIEEAFLKALQAEYLQMLRDEYQEQLYGETLDENIRANEYTFLQTGERFDAPELIQA